MREQILRHLPLPLDGGMPVWRRAARSALDHVFGPLPIDARAHPGDPGLCGPGSASWRILADPAAIVGGFRALLVQLLHPHAMAGVADHSAFRGDPLARLRNTSSYVLTVTFGATPEVLEITRLVRRIHRPVHGVAPDGRPYRAEDPHLLAWVSIALTSSFLTADRMFGARPAGGAEADAFVAEQSRLAALLDPRVDLEALATDPTAAAAFRRGELALPMLQERRLPTNVSELEAALDAYGPELAVNEQGREGLRFLLWPPVSAPIKAGYLPLLAGALTSIEPERRALFGPALGRLASPLATVNTRLLIGALRGLRGPSPALVTAERRAAAPREPTAA